MPDPRYRSMPSSVVGGTTRSCVVLNWRPWVRSVTHQPVLSMYSPGVMVGAVPTTVTRSRWPRTLTRSTQKPVSSLWKVTRSTLPARGSRGVSRGGGDVNWGMAVSLHRRALHVCSKCHTHTDAQSVDHRRQACEPAGGHDRVPVPHHAWALVSIARGSTAVADAPPGDAQANSG